MSSACVMNSSSIVLCSLVVFAAPTVLAATRHSSPALVIHCVQLKLICSNNCALISYTWDMSLSLRWPKTSVLWGVIPCSLVNLYQTKWSHNTIDNVFHCLCVFRAGAEHNIFYPEGW